MPGIEKRICTNADKTDVHGPGRRYYTSYRRPGVTKAVKRATNRRERQARRRAVRLALTEYR